MNPIDQVLKNQPDHGLMGFEWSQGLIHDRSREFLGTSDRGVVVWRKLAFNSIAAAKAGRDPHGIVRGGDDTGGNDVIRFDAGKNFSDHDKSPVAAS